MKGDSIKGPWIFKVVPVLFAFVPPSGLAGEGNQADIDRILFEQSAGSYAQNGRPVDDPWRYSCLILDETTGEVLLCPPEDQQDPPSKWERKQLMLP